MALDLLGPELPSHFGAKVVPKGGPFCTYVQCLGILFELLFLDLFLKDFVDGFWCPRVQFSRFSGVADMAKV